MNMLLTLASALVLAGPAQTAPSQNAPGAASRNPTPSQAKAIKSQTAEHRADTYKGPKVVKDSKALGRKFIRESKPTDTNVPVPVKPRKE